MTKTHDTVVLTWGRMNPPTKGHQKLVEHMKTLAETYKADARVYLSHTVDLDDNPLPYTTKIKLAKEAFGDIVIKSKHRTIIKTLQECADLYKNLIFVAGDDRVEDLEEMVRKYNGKEYTFENIIIESCGKRNEDSLDIEGVSASLARDFAIAEEFEAFKDVMPEKLQESAKSIYNAIRGSMLSCLTEDEIQQLDNNEVELSEELSAAQRRMKARAIVRTKIKRQRGKERAQRKLASDDKLQARAKKQARNVFKKKAAGGKDVQDLAYAQRQNIEKRLQNPSRKRQIDNLAKRLLPKVRKAERKRLADFRSKKNATNEEVVYDLVNLVHNQLKEDKD